MTKSEKIKSTIRTIPDFPKKGIQFRDITTLLLNADAFRETIDLIADQFRDKQIDYIAGIEARGFIIGSALAYKMGTGFVPVRKKGKLPGNTIEYTYELEYGTDTIAMHDDALQKGQKILLIDDLLATGGTAIAAAKLIEKFGAVVAGIAFIVDLPDVGGKEKLNREGYGYFAVCEFEGD